MKNLFVTFLLWACLITALFCNFTIMQKVKIKMFSFFWGSLGEILGHCHCVNSVQVRSFFWSVFGHISHSVCCSVFQAVSNFPNIFCSSLLPTLQFLCRTFSSSFNLSPFCYWLYIICLLFLSRWFPTFSSLIVHCFHYHLLPLEVYAFFHFFLDFYHSFLMCSYSLLFVVVPVPHVSLSMNSLFSLFMLLLFNSNYLKRNEI